MTNRNKIFKIYIFLNNHTSYALLPCHKNFGMVISILCLKLIFPLIKEYCLKVRKQLLKYELSVSMSFNRNPFDCPKCGTKLDFVLLY